MPAPVMAPVMEPGPFQICKGGEVTAGCEICSIGARRMHGSWSEFSIGS